MVNPQFEFLNFEVNLTSGKLIIISTKNSLYFSKGNSKNNNHPASNKFAPIVYVLSYQISLSEVGGHFAIICLGVVATRRNFKNTKYRIKLQGFAIWAACQLPCMHGSLSLVCCVSGICDACVMGQLLTSVLLLLFRSHPYLAPSQVPT